MVQLRAFIGADLSLCAKLAIGLLTFKIGKIVQIFYTLGQIYKHVLKLDNKFD